MIEPSPRCPRCKGEGETPAPKDLLHASVCPCPCTDEYIGTRDDFGKVRPRHRRRVLEALLDEYGSTTVREAAFFLYGEGTPHTNGRKIVSQDLIWLEKEGQVTRKKGTDRNTGDIWRSVYRADPDCGTCDGLGTTRKVDKEREDPDNLLSGWYRCTCKKARLA